MSIWTLHQYKTVIYDFIPKCDKPTQNKADQHFDWLRQLGDQLEMPVCKYLTDGLYELRPKSVRLLFYFELEKKKAFFVCTHKKSLPKKERNRLYKLAQKRRIEILLDEVTTNVIN